MVFKRTTFYYEKPGKEHTENTLKIALEAAIERDIGTILVASTTGKTALKALEIFKENGINLVVVAHQYGWRAPGKQLMPQKVVQKIRKSGAKVVFCTDALAGGVEVGISQQRPGKTNPMQSKLPYIVPPITRVISSTLKLFGNPVKVCVSIAMMAADTGIISIEEKVISVAGSHSGADTAMVITPSTTNRILDLKIHEILVKPYL
jgi:hypothetical protein